MSGNSILMKSQQDTWKIMQVILPTGRVDDMICENPRGTSKEGMLETVSKFYFTR